MIAMISQESPDVPIGFICEHFGFSRSGFYDWQRRNEPTRFTKKHDICEAIKKIFIENHKTYGSPRVYEALRILGFQVSENTVAKYMRELGLDARLKKKFRVVTTDSNHSSPIADRLLKVEDHQTLP